MLRVNFYRPSYKSIGDKSAINSQIGDKLQRKNLCLFEFFARGPYTRYCVVYRIKAISNKRLSCRTCWRRKNYLKWCKQEQNLFYKEMTILAFAHSGNSASFFETLKINFTLYFSLITSSFSIACVISVLLFIAAIVRKLSKYISSKS